MKKTAIILAFMAALCLPVSAQWSESFASTDANYTEGISLYQQGQYAAALVYLQDYKDDFYYIACLFEMRERLTAKQLRLLEEQTKEYLSSHPYTTYASEVNYMLGVISYEEAMKSNDAKHDPDDLIASSNEKAATKGFSRALRYFGKAEAKELFRPHQESIHYYRGYAQLVLGQVNRSLPDFAIIRDGNTKFAVPGKYYYAYCQYALGNYSKALSEFEALQDDPRYGDIAAYYLIQIYYEQGRYDEVLTRAKKLVATDPNNPNIGEVYRIMGEIAYQKGNYDDAINYLKKYEALYSAKQKQLVREDLYLLGVSEYKTGDISEARRYLSQVESIENDTLTQSTKLHLGHVNRLQGMTMMAKSAYKTAMDSKAVGATAERTREEAAYNYALLAYEAPTALEPSAPVLKAFLAAYPSSEHCSAIRSLLADVYMQEKDYNTALASLEEVDDPKGEMALTKQYLRYQVATDQFLNSKHPLAIEWFNQVIAHRSDAGLSGKADAAAYLRESYFWKAESEYRLTEYDSASVSIGQFLAQPTATQSANYLQANYLKGYICFQQKDYVQASSAFKTYVGKADKNLITYADALNRLGDCAFSQRDFVQAESYYAKVQQTNSSGADYATFQRGYTLGLMRRYGDKITQMENLVKKYPKSDYLADALYEIARAELQRDNNAEAIDAYNRLIAAKPKSALARKGALEKAMLYYNEQDYANAEAAYKAVIAAYPNSSEAKSALEGLETCYVETNRVQEYQAYAGTLKNGLKTSSTADSLLFAAAEHQYMLGNFSMAAPTLRQYIQTYCEGAHNCTNAHYYLADCYYQINKKDSAQREFIALAAIEGNPYMEEACMRVAEVAYDKQDYRTALNYFQKMQDVASTNDRINIARLGVLRCAYNLGEHEKSVAICTTVLNDPSADYETKDEARYNRAKANLALQQYAAAVPDLETISQEVRTAHGAECKYQLAQCYFDMNETDQAENQVMEFAGLNTSHQYWLARAFVLLSDIYVRRGDDFQAQQYLLSLQQNYHAEDDIQSICEQRLQAIASHNTNNENDNEDENN